MKKLSIIVPVYNVERYLSRCINSILNQTYKNFELILIDDGSTDSSGEICDEYLFRDDRVKVMHIENGGVNKARVLGVNIAEGEFISFIDSDDWIEPNMYEILMSDLLSYNADVAICGQNRVFEDGSVEQVLSSGVFCVLDRLEALRQLFQFKIFGWNIWDKIYKKELFVNQSFPACITHGEDLVMCVKLMSKAQKVVYNPNVGYHYFYRNNSATTGGFSEKNLSELEAHKIVQAVIAESCPSLINITATKFLERRILLILSLLFSNKKDKTVFLLLQTDLKRNFFRFLKGTSNYKYKLTGSLCLMPYNILRFACGCIRKGRINITGKENI